MKRCLQLLSHFLQSSLYFFLPRSSRKNANSSLRYFGIRGIASTSFSLPICSRNAEMPKTSPNCHFSGRFWAFSFDMSKGTLFNYLLYFFFLLTTVVPMAAPPLTNSKAIHKARLLVSPVCGDLESSFSFAVTVSAFLISFVPSLSL